MIIPAQIFDPFGLVGFVGLFFISLRIIKDKKVKHLGYLSLLISIMGIIVDCYSIITNFILP